MRYTIVTVIAVLTGIFALNARSIAAQPPAPILAYYPLDGTPDDCTGNSQPMVLANTSFTEDALSLNGIYGGVGNASGSYEALADIRGFSLQSFTVAVDILPVDTTCLDFDHCHRCILTGGQLGRWLALDDLGGRLEIAVNNHALTFNTGAAIQVGVWQRVICSVNLSNETIVTFVNGQQFSTITLPAGFAFNPYGDLGFYFTDYGTGNTFDGNVRNLTVLGRALLPAEITALQLECPPQITTGSSLPSAYVGLVYSQALSATSGTTPYAWAVVSNSLPTGLTLNPDGTITGTPPSAVLGQNFRVRVTDAINYVTESNLSMDVLRPPVPFGPHDSLAVSESLQEALSCGYYIDVGEHINYCDSYTNGSATIKAILFSGQSINPAQFDQSTPFRISMGGWSFDGALGDDPKYAPGAKTATLLLTYEKYAKEPPVDGTITLSFSPAGVAVSVSLKTGVNKNGAALESSILANEHAGHSGSFTDTTTANIQLGVNFTSVDVACSGIGIVKDVTKAGTEYGLDNVTLNGAVGTIAKKP